MGGIELTKARTRVIEMVCSLYGVDFHGDTLSRRINSDTAGSDVLALCEAITRVSNLIFELQQPQQPHLRQEVETLIRLKIEPHRRYVRDWSDPSIDPEKTHTIDYHFNADASPRNLFLVTSKSKAEIVAGTIHFYESRQRSAPAIAVLDPSVKLPRDTDKRLRKAASEVRRGVAGNEDAIAAFVLAAAVARK